MRNSLFKNILVAVLTLAVLLGAYLGFVRYLSELGGKQVELVVDLNDLKKMAAYEKRPLGPVLDEIRQTGISEIGVFEETLPDAAALGELVYAKGSGVLRLPHPAFAPLVRAGLIKPDAVYIYAPDGAVRKRIFDQLRWALGDKAVRAAGGIIIADEVEEELRELGLGISESQRDFLAARGFTIVPRLRHDPRYNLGNLEDKISGLQGYSLVVFDGDKILGYPDALPALAAALKKYHLKYGAVEIVKQDGDTRLKKIMGDEAVRVHSVPKDELAKISKEEALDRFVRAARERGVRVIYLRPFLPPQIDAFPVEYNLEYFKTLQAKLAASGFMPGPAEKTAPLAVRGWQIILLGAGVLAGALFLLDTFIALPFEIGGLLLLAGLFFIGLTGLAGYTLILQKLLALLAAIVFPAGAVIAAFSRPVKKAGNHYYEAVLAILNVLAETSIGIFLMIGLLADYRFMNGNEVFPAVKAALIFPVLIVALYFFLKSADAGGFQKRLRQLLETRITILTALIGLAVLAALAVLVLRSGNFSLPVPGFEKHFRDWLESLLYIRPRTKEFLVGYPALFLAALYYLKGGRRWLWLLAAIGVIAPIDVFNSFSHIHTPIVVSLTRTFSGLIIGLIVGALAGALADRYFGKRGP